MVREKKSMDMLSGSLWNKILMFALPLAASSMLQQLFNSADIAVVGQFAGSRALAAVGSNGPIINLLVNIFVGLSVGANVVISRFIGQGREKQVEEGVHTAICTAIVSGIFLLVLGVSVTKPMLVLMSAPDDIIDLAALYLKIYFLGMPFIMIYNFGSAILRSRGDTKRPFICLVLSGVVNVLLNLFFVIVCRLSVAGVGIATLVSNIISASLILYFLTHERGMLKLNLKKLRINIKILKEIAKIGIPAGVQGMVFSLSNICIQSAVNSLGSDVVAGCAAAVNLECFVFFLINAFSQANVTFISQNYGARNEKRCTRTMALCLGMGLLSAALMSGLFILFGRALLHIYTNEPAVIDIAYSRLRFVVTFQIINAVIDIASGSMRGLGYSAVPALISVAGVCGLRLVWVYTVFAAHHDFITLMAAYPVSWVVTAAAILISYFILRKRAFNKTAVPEL